METLMELRVEELAARGGVSVDTVRFYQKQGLLDPPRREGRVAWYSADHLARLQRIKDLQARGFTLAVISRLLAGELDAGDERLAAALVESPGEEDEEFLTLDELAARAGVPAALISAVAKEGLLVPRIHDGEERYTTADLEALAAGLRLIDKGLPLPELLALARHHHEVTREIAEEAVSLFDDHIRAPLRDSAMTDEARADQLVDAFRTLLPAVTTLVAHHFRRVLLSVAQEHLESVGEPAEIEAAREEARRRLEIVPSQ